METLTEALQKLLDQALELTSSLMLPAIMLSSYLVLVLSPLKPTQNKEKHPIRESEKATA